MLVMDRNRDPAAHDSAPTKMAKAEVAGCGAVDSAPAQVRMHAVQRQSETQRWIDASFFRNQFLDHRPVGRRSSSAGDIVDTMQPQCRFTDRITLHRRYEVQYIASGAAGEAVKHTALQIHMEGFFPLAAVNRTAPA